MTREEQFQEIKMNNKGEIFWEPIFFCLLLLVPLCLLAWYVIMVVFPIELAKRDYLLANPSQIAVTEWQRGGELPKIPEINVNMKGQP